ncbi:MAG: hypothetical protein ACSLE6_18850 [Mycobacterium sp.]
MSPNENGTSAAATGLLRGAPPGPGRGLTDSTLPTGTPFIDGVVNVYESVAGRPGLFLFAQLRAVMTRM